MKRALMITAVAAAIFGGTAGFGNEAQASTIVSKYGYVCTVTYYPFPGTSSGNYGSLGLTVYTGANCTGSYVSWVNVFSAGATGKGYAYLHDQQTLLRMMQSYTLRESTPGPNSLMFAIDDTSLGLYYGNF